MSGQERSPKEFLKVPPRLRRWVNECASCHHRGYKPDTPKPQFDNTASTLAKLRRLLNELVLDETGVCEQCSRLRHPKEMSGSPPGTSSTGPECRERERLDAAYRDALRAKEQVEGRICAQIVCVDSNQKKRAKRELDRAEQHTHNILRELLAHGKKHGCGL